LRPRRTHAPLLRNLPRRRQLKSRYQSTVVIHTTPHCSLSAECRIRVQIRWIARRCAATHATSGRRANATSSWAPGSWLLALRAAASKQAISLAAPQLAPPHPTSWASTTSKTASGWHHPPRCALEHETLRVGRIAPCAGVLPCTDLERVQTRERKGLSTCGCVTGSNLYLVFVRGVVGPVVSSFSFQDEDAHARTCTPHHTILCAIRVRCAHTHVTSTIR
jgi:hypothetical protein